MKVLTICKNGKELVRAPIYGNSAIIGRSPACEVLLRQPNIKPVHFLMESLEHGDGDERFWVLTDISGTRPTKEKDVLQNAEGQGIVLSEQGGALAGYDFIWKEDRLEKPKFAGGGIKEMLDGEIRPSEAAKKYFLEISIAREKNSSMVDVVHLPIPKKRSVNSPIGAMPGLKILYPGKSPNPVLRLSVAGVKGGRFYQKGNELSFGQGAPGQEVNLEKNDVFRIQWNLKDYYFRIVPQVVVPPVRRTILKDRFFLAVMLSSLCSGAFLYWILNGDFVKPEAPKPPPRIAKIEIKQLKPKPPPPPPKPKVAEKKQKQVKSDVKKKNPDSGGAQTSRFKNKKKRKPKNGLNTPAPKKDVNSVGLLAALGKPKPQKSKVSADMVLNDGIVSKNITGAGAKFKIEQGPAGNIGSSSEEEVNVDIGQASTTLEVGDVVDPNANSPLAVKNPKNKNKDFSIGFGNKGVGGQKFNADGEEKVFGGLDKESVRRALSFYRRQIRTCYEKALLRSKSINGRIVYRWTIAPSGSVSSIALDKSDIGNPTLENCVMAVVQQIKFPKAPNKQPTEVIYPFAFQSRK